MPLPTEYNDNRLLSVRDRWVVQLLNEISTNSTKATLADGSTATEVTVKSSNGYPALDQEVWRASFADVGANLLSSKFSKIGDGYWNGSAMITGATAISQSAGNLVVTTSTVANDEVILRSLESGSPKYWAGAFTARWKTILSQRIINNNFLVLLADQIGLNLSFTSADATSVVVNIPNNPFTSMNVGQSMELCGIVQTSGASACPPQRAAIASVSGDNVTFTVAGYPAGGSTGTIDLIGWNYIRCLYDSTVATAVKFDTQKYGWNSGDTSLTAQPTTAGVGHIGQLYNDNSQVSIGFGLTASNANGTAQITSAGNRTDNIPEDTTNLYMFMISRNGTTNPLSATTWTTGFTIVEKWNRLPVTVSNLYGGSGGALPVTATNLSTNIAQVAAGTASSMIEQAGTTNRALNVSVAAPSRANVVEVASAAVTATATGATITQVAGAGFSAVVNATAVTGTNPTLDTILQESNDDGTTWYDIWHCERMTGVSTAIIPALPSGGRRRWNSTVSGTSPSFTRQINTMLLSVAPPVLQRQFFDRTAGLLSGTLNSTSASYNMAGIDTMSANVTIGAATTPGTYQIQVSNDGVNWAAASVATLAVANSTVTIPRTAGVMGRFARLICTVAATAQTGTVVSFYGSN